jgi:hypothetical protein
MRALTVLMLSLFLGVSYVAADYDPALEAQEAAERAAAQRAEQARKAEADKIMAQARAKQEAALMQDKRKQLGSAAVGKSDAEVNRLYDEKVKADTAEATAAARDARQKINDPSANAQMKAATGKSMQEIMSMSPEEQEAWAAEMEKKMGAGQ